VLDLSRKAASGKANVDEINHGAMACLIGAWSFNTPCTMENKIQAVKHWPQTLVNFIDKRASSRISFFTKAESDSANTPKSSDGSANQSQKEAKPRAKTTTRN